MPQLLHTDALVGTSIVSASKHSLSGIGKPSSWRSYDQLWQSQLQLKLAVDKVHESLSVWQLLLLASIPGAGWLIVGHAGQMQGLASIGHRRCLPWLTDDGHDSKAYASGCRLLNGTARRAQSPLYLSMICRACQALELMSCSPASRH